MTGRVQRSRRTLVWAVPLVVVALLVGWVLLLPHLPWTMVYRSEIRQGNQLIAKIESFRKRHARLPDPEKIDELLLLGFELRTGYYPEYRRLGNNSYDLEYYIGFDGPRIIYSSSVKQWRCELCR